MSYKVAFDTLGCRLNQAETAVFQRQFMARGCRIVNDTADADLCVINTCTLTSQATAKCRRRIRSILRKNPDACIAAVGCYAQTEAESLKAIGGLDYIVGTADKMRLADIISSPVKLPEPVVIRRPAARERFTIDLPGFYPNHTRANVKIQEGCNFVCSFCIIPKSRGPARSRDFDDLVGEARALAEMGHREIVLTGINVGTYEEGGRRLLSVVDALERIDVLERIRISSIEPTTIEGRLVDRMAAGGSGKLCPYLHIPLQSGDDGVLARMRRKYTAGEYRDFIGRVLDRVPAIGLGTDVIVGFPGESDDAFEKTCRMIESIPYTNIHVFSFSAREGTGAHRMSGRVPARVVAERSAELHRIADEKKRQFYQNQMGLRLRVLFEERESSGHMIGFSDNYVKVGVRAPNDLSNRLGTVRIAGVTAPNGGTPILAVGELIDIEDGTAAGLAGRRI